MLTCFHTYIKEEIHLDEHGLEHLSPSYYFYALALIFLYFSTFFATWLTWSHTFFMLNNETSWESVKRNSISYLKHAPAELKHPFSKGYIENIRLFFSVDPDHPIEWKIPPNV